ncbi:MAG: type II toxin-antitoxin system ParD family antitoxin [Proteobacteria bacterium]|nr:type II toxin-antitoxin system ParD family antitoxin [Pseudomonadota bacterium]
MNELSIALPKTLRSWIDQQVQFGRFVDASDYLRDLVRRDQENTWRLRDLVEEGLASGVVDEEPEDVIERIIAEAAQRNG